MSATRIGVRGQRWVSFLTQKNEQVCTHWLLLIRHGSRRRRVETAFPDSALPVLLEFGDTRQLLLQQRVSKTWRRNTTASLVASAALYDFKWRVPNHVKNKLEWVKKNHLHVAVEKGKKAALALSSPLLPDTTMYLLTTGLRTANEIVQIEKDMFALRSLLDGMFATKWLCEQHGGDAAVANGTCWQCVVRFVLLTKRT
jgi:hypothetical protein